MSLKGGLSVASRNSGRFDWNYNLGLANTAPDNMVAAVANAFYVANVFHDVMYRYGFTESWFNFQHNNFGRGGTGGDAIRILVQDSNTVNVGEFITPPDGQPGVLKLGLSSASLDAGMDNNIIVQKLSNGLVTRMVGGNGAASSCLDSLEGQALTQGWSDSVAWWATMQSWMTRTTDRHMTQGRLYPYSTNTQTNPTLLDMFYKRLMRDTPLDTGMMWSIFLYEVYWALVEKAGFSQDIFDANLQGGNIRFMKNLIESLKTVPCNPNTIQARDAFIAANQRNYNGAFECDIWKAFAKRGLGRNAGRRLID
ncbi:hypothetical protein HDU67_005278, partial [Dinochytrium kinnereticum]